MEYVSPFDESTREPQPLATRPRDLSGRHVALLDISKARGAEFLDEVERLLSERGARTSRHAKPTFSRPAPAELVEELAEEADLVVEGLAD
jgi:nucleotide-binding universal stress UspA family protein